MAKSPSFPYFDLADFDAPPVVETVLSLQFERLEKLRAVHLGAFWQTVRHRFPNSEEQPPLFPTFEHFPEPSSQAQFEAIQAPLVPRVWLINAAGTEVIQVQSDRFIKNWRKSAVDDAYPRYEPVIRPAFEHDLQEFQTFLDREGLGSLKVTQCEVTYVNHIVAGEGWQRFGEADRVFRFWQPPPGPTPGSPDNISLRVHFPIANQHGRALGKVAC